MAASSIGEFQGGAHFGKVQPLSHLSNLNAFAERFIHTLPQEALDGFAAIGTGHLLHLNTTFADHYNCEHTCSSDGRWLKRVVSVKML